MFADWRELPLPQILDFQEGPGIMARDFRPEGVPLIRLAGLKQGAPLLAGCDRLDEEQVSKRWNHFRLQLGDVLLSTSASLGETSTVDTSGIGAIAYTGIIRFRPKTSEILANFIPHALTAPSFKRQIEAMGVGSVIKHFGPTHLRQMTIHLPPVSHQRAIAEVLGALDEKIAVNERIAETAMEIARARYALTPATAEMRIADIATVFDGPHATPQKTPHGPWFLSISSLKGGVLDLAESAHLSEDDFPRWTKRVQPQEGDVLFSYETRLGEAALMPAGVRACLGRRMGLLRPRSASVNGTLLLHAYLSREFQKEIRRRTVHGATVDRIPLKEMPSWPISLPVEDDREDLISALNALHSKITHTAEENRTLATLRDTLLPQLVTGKLRIKDAERAVEDAV
ncbi:restriction endonuclease subunit S [Streptomyces kebangsaanensis]|uniref:restriction endonuclease subunit S n=1 Tax=Streptomyces kebangsaanensis TaxID=864058 RepID=UPI000938FF13|nr:restriction endonuclease subunit S [Streptomyces kebangsaanensis]